MKSWKKQKTENLYIELPTGEEREVLVNWIEVLDTETEGNNPDGKLIQVPILIDIPELDRINDENDRSDIRRAVRKALDVKYDEINGVA